MPGNGTALSHPRDGVKRGGGHPCPPSGCSDSKSSQRARDAPRHFRHRLSRPRLRFDPKASLQNRPRDEREVRPNIFPFAKVRSLTVTRRSSLPLIPTYLELLLLVLPVFALIGVGVAARRVHW